MSNNYINYNGSNIFYRKTGSGPYVILIHGFGEDGNIWKYQEAFLKDSFTLIIPDLTGSGRSEILEQDNIGDDILIERYADTIKTIIDNEAITECSVIGHSMGGYIALALTEKYTEYIKGLGLFHSTAFADSEEKKEARKKGIAFIEKYGAQEFLKQAIPNLFAPDFVNSNKNEVDELIEAGDKFTAAALVQYYRAMMARPDRVEVLKNTSAPVLFIIGEVDKSVPLQDSLQQCYIPTKSFVNIYPGVAHMGMWEAKKQSDEALLEFLNYATGIDV